MRRSYLADSSHALRCMWGGGGHNGRVRVFSVVDYLCMQYKPSLSLCVCLPFVCYSVTDGTVTLTLRG